MKSAFIVTALIFLNIGMVFAQDKNRLMHFNHDNEIAIQGYDPVAYFSGKSVKGKKEFGAITYGGIKYYFSSLSNKETFKNSPATYEPQYGGWCAYAMGNDGTKVEIDPETFKIVDGKLFLFYNKYFTNTLKSWNKQEAELKKKADKNWQKIYP